VNSSSSSLEYLPLLQALKTAGEAVCFSYRSPGQPFGPEDTHNSIAGHVANLQAHIDRLDPAASVTLAGHSLGGLVICEWATSLGVSELHRVDRIALLASPVWATTAGAALTAYPLVSRVAGDYEFDWPTFRTSVMPRVELLVLRAPLGHDRLVTLDAEWISFEARRIDVLELGVPGTNHFTIVGSLLTAEVLAAWLTGVHLSRM
jgi:pimeloyl-ACP methyl ester carboxylesterase